SAPDAPGSELGEPWGRLELRVLEHDVVLLEERSLGTAPGRDRDGVVEIGLYLGGPGAGQALLEVEQVLRGGHPHLVALLLAAQVLLGQLARHARRVDALAAREDRGDALAPLA